MSGPQKQEIEFPPEMSPSSRLMQHRSSLFEVPLFRPKAVGSSVMEFACDPRADQSMLLPKPKKVEYENTYRMDPPVKFKADTVTAIIREVLDDCLTGRTYEPINCSFLCKTLAQEIKERVKALEFERYKIVSTVSIGEKKDQGVRVGSRCIWDADRDNFSSAYFENPDIYAVGTVYGLYYE